MKQKFVQIWALMLTLIYVPEIAAQNNKDTMIFRPSRGLNNGTDQGGINGGKDAWVYENEPGMTHDSSYMLYSMPVSDCNNTHAWSLIRFDLTDLPSAVDSVLVGFAHYSHTDYCYSHCSASWNFYKINSAWEENTVTYNTVPSLGSSFYGPINITFPNSLGTREYNITEQYNWWKIKPDSNFGFAMRSLNVGCNNACVGFYVYSSDDTAVDRRPYLKIYHAKTNSLKKATRELNMYPNPADQELRIQIGAGEKGQTRVFDISGRTVWSGQIDAAHSAIPTASLENGMYVVEITLGSESSFKRIMVRHR